MKVDVAIIGAGASGMLAAILLAKKGKKVVLIERQERGGKKILASGNGHCNITNAKISVQDFYGSGKIIIQNLLPRCAAKKIEKVFNELGLPLVKKEENKLFPASIQAAIVLELLEEALKRYKVEVIYNAKEYELFHDFRVKLPQKTIKAKKLIIATGSSAAPQLGGNESTLMLAKKFGHAIKPFFPALVPMESNATLCKKLNGLKIACGATLIVNKKRRQRVFGDVLFRSYGLSGLAILDLSIEASLAFSKGNSILISLDFFPQFNVTKLSSYLKERIDLQRNLPLPLWLGALLPKKLALEILKKRKLHKAFECDLNHFNLKELASTMKNLLIPIEKMREFKYAEVAIGGVHARELNAKTLESKKKKGLYFIGEAVDIVGKRGGYNFHFAWCSAIKVANSIK